MNHGLKPKKLGFSIANSNLTVLSNGVVNVPTCSPTPPPKTFNPRVFGWLSVYLEYVVCNPFDVC